MSPKKKDFQPTNVEKQNSFSQVITAPKSNSTNKSCNTCKHYRRGDCGGLMLCSDFEYAPTVTPDETKYWPKEGDATYIKRTGRSRNRDD